MKTLIQKELRENLKVAAVGFLLAIAVTVGTQLYYINMIEDIASGAASAQNYYYRLQPLSSDNFQFFSAVLCGLVGVTLGWFQVQSERHRDLWAFLVHRPVTRTTIFLSKVIAGLALYLLSVGLPLAYFILWAKTPGHVAAPFEWTMLWPVAAAIFSGLFWYFAGMLTSIRQARWYGSRVLGLVAAFGATILMYSDQVHLWLEFFILLTLAVSVWGAFHNRGLFEGQPAAGKAALTLSLTPGTGFTVFAAMTLILQVTVGLGMIVMGSHYVLGLGGIIYKVSNENDASPVTTLDGKPFMDPDTGKPMELAKFNRRGTPAGVAADFGQKSPYNRPQSAWFHLLQGNRHTLWFQVNSTGRILGYDAASRRFIGGLGPEGFVASEKGDGTGFLPHNEWAYGWSESTAEILASTNRLFQVDFDNRAVRNLWTAPQGEPIVGCGTQDQGSETLVLTPHQIVYFDNAARDPRPTWAVPFEYASEEYPSVSVSLTATKVEGEPGRHNDYCVWISPSLWMEFQDDSKLPTHVLRLDDAGQITKREELPSLAVARKPRVADRVMSAVLPSAIILAEPLLNFRGVHSKIIWSDLPTPMAIGAMCAVAGLLLGLRYSFTARQQAIWGLFLLLGGIPAFLAFLAVQEWPACERCVNCGKLRSVQSETCQHCAAALPAPKPNGTEIFESLETA